jgi:hypothetical protein
MNNRLIPIAALLVISTLLTVAPGKITEYARRRYLRRNKLFQKWPFANMVLKPWYPTYLRFMGLFGFALALLFIVDTFSK